MLFRVKTLLNKIHAPPQTLDQYEQP